MNKPCMNKECEYYRHAYGNKCSVWDSDVDIVEYCKKYQPQKSELREMLEKAIKWELEVGGMAEAQYIKAPELKDLLLVIIDRIESD